MIDFDAWIYIKRQFLWNVDKLNSVNVVSLTKYFE